MKGADVERFYGVCAAFYDADYEAAGYDRDIGFYVELARAAGGAGGGSVLELGCGTGRVLLPTARALDEAGSDALVVGVDVSAAMLARLEERLAAEPAGVRERVRLVQGDIRTADVRVHAPDGFALATAPFRVVHHLVEPADQRAWLANVSRHLRSNGAARRRSTSTGHPGGCSTSTGHPGGCLVFDLFQPDYSMVADPPSLSVDIERIDPATGKTVRRVSSARHEPESQTFEVEFEWLVEGDDGEEETIEAGVTLLRWFTRAEVELLLELEGFETPDVWGDFDRTPYGSGAEAIVVRARPASDPP